MTWVKLDDHFFMHPKVLAVGPAAAWLWVASIGYANANLTDGFVPAASLPLLAHVPPTKARELAAKLVTARLWEPAEGGYRIHDYTDWNPTAAEVRSNREHLAKVRSEAGRAGGKQSGRSRAEAKSKQVASGVADDVLEQTATPSPAPTPVEEPSSKVLVARRATGAQLTLAPAEPKPRKPPADVVDLLATLERESDGRFVAGEPAGWAGEHIIRVRKVRKVYRDPAAWQTLAAWWGAGFDEHRGDTITIDAIAGKGFGPSMTHALEWERRGRRDAPPAGGRHAAPARPSVDQPVFVSERPRGQSALDVFKAQVRKASNE